MTRRRGAARALRIALTLLAGAALADAAHAWSNHALGTWPALAALPELHGAAPVPVEPLEAFLAAEAAGLAPLLQQEEAWARAHVATYPPRPDTLAFAAEANAPGTPGTLTARFVAALRINPAARLRLYLQLPPGADRGSRPPLTEADVTPLKRTESTKFNGFVALRAGETVPVADVIATATDEPDYGLDIGVWSDNGTSHGKVYGFGKQPFGNPALEFSSQAPLHLGYFHEAAIVYTAAPFLRRTYPEYRIHLYRTLAAYALRHGHPYWGWRFAGWALHYVQDLTQPYHARVLPGVGTPRMLWINALDLVGLHTPKNDAITFVSNRHLALENFELRWLRDAHTNHRSDDAALRALADTSRDAQTRWRDDAPREVVALESFAQADALDAALVRALAPKYTADPAYVFGVTETGLDLYTESKGRIVPGSEASTAIPGAGVLTQAIAPLLANFGTHTRAFVRALLAE